MAGGDDLVVVGGGPAGALTALLVARAGWRVRVFDRDRFPRQKLCGDTLNPGALAILARHLAIDDLCRLGQPLRGMRLSGPDGTVVDTAYPAGVAGLSVTRSVLDHWLVQRAVEAGVQVDEDATVLGPAVHQGVVEGVLLHGHAAPRRHHGRLVVAADGRRSALAAALSLARTPVRPRRWAIGAYLVGVDDVRDDRGEMHVRAGRYLGIAPVPGGLTNVCLVVPYLEARRVAGAPATWLLATAASDRATAGRFTRAAVVGRPVTLGPMAVDVLTPGAPGLLLAGDAAGFVDPMTGDGLRLALAGAEQAAVVAIDVLEGRLTKEAAAARLANRRRAALGVKPLFNRAVRALVDVPGAIGAAAVLTRLWPHPLQAMVRYAGDVGLAAAPSAARR